MQTIHFPLGICFFAVPVYFYRACPQTLPINNAFLPVSGVSYVLIGILSILTLKEKFTWNLLAGNGIVIGGQFIANIE
jgi:hypothetical protein